MLMNAKLSRTPPKNPSTPRTTATLSWPHPCHVKATKRKRSQKQKNKTRRQKRNKISGTQGFPTSRTYIYLHTYLSIYCGTTVGWGRGGCLGQLIILVVVGFDLRSCVCRVWMECVCGEGVDYSPRCHCCAGWAWSLAADLAPCWHHPMPVLLPACTPAHPAILLCRQWERYRLCAAHPVGPLRCPRAAVRRLNKAKISKT